MSPILGAETLSQIEEFDEKKFVRDGDVIAFDRWQIRHVVIADFNKLGSRVPGKRPLEDMDAVNVDDAGSLFIIGDKLRVSGDSTTCVIRGERDEQRNKTVGIIQKFTDKKIVSE